MSVTRPSNLSNSAIATYAERVGKALGIYDSSGAADVRKMASALGGVVRVSDSRESLHVFSPTEFLINIPDSTSGRRDTFTIAHELGHFFLHYLLPKHSDPKSFGRGGRDRAETEANVFASSLLMPQEQFTTAFREKGGDSFALANQFSVSPAAAEVRARVLGLS